MLVSDPNARVPIVIRLHTAVQDLGTPLGREDLIGQC